MTAWTIDTNANLYRVYLYLFNTFRILISSHNFRIMSNFDHDMIIFSEEEEEMDVIKLGKALSGLQPFGASGRWGTSSSFT